MTQRPKHISSDRPLPDHQRADRMLAQAPAQADERRELRLPRASAAADTASHGAVRPGEARFDARAWRQTTREDQVSDAKPHRAPEPAWNEAAPHPKHAKPTRDAARPSPAALVAAAASTETSHDGGKRWRYLAVWAVLGSISAAYVAGMAWQRSANFDLAIAPVTESLERLANDIVELRQVTAAIDKRERATSDRVAVTETRINRFAEAASPMTATPPPSQAVGLGQRPTNRAVLAEDTPAAAAAEPARPQRPAMAGVVLAQPGPSPGIVVGSAPAVIPADTKPAAKAPAPAQPVNPVRTGSVGAKSAGLLIASGPSLDAVRLSWNVISQNHGAVLGPVEPRISPAGDGSIFQLIAGPYASDAEAAKACSNLRARGVTCRLTEYSGTTL